MRRSLLLVAVSLFAATVGLQAETLLERAGETLAPPESPHRARPPAEPPPSSLLWGGSTQAVFFVVCFSWASRGLVRWGFGLRTFPLRASGGGLWLQRAD